MIEDKWCFNCGYSLKMKRVRDDGGEHLTFYDGKTGEIVQDCPNCHNWPLAVYGIESKESADAMLKREGPYIKPPDKGAVLDKLIRAIGRHPVAENDPSVIDAINDIAKELEQLDNPERM